MTVTILVGTPGSGKSNWAHNKIDDETIIINQDILGSRNVCLERMEFWLKHNKNVIIDRTNINKKQRSYFINLAKKYKPDEINCVVFKSSPEECIKRIQARKNHATITEDFSIDKITDIVLKFVHSYEEPKNHEGFDTISTIHIDKLLGQNDNCSGN